MRHIISTIILEGVRSIVILFSKARSRIGLLSVFPTSARRMNGEALELVVRPDRVHLFCSFPPDWHQIRCCVVSKAQPAANSARSFQNTKAACRRCGLQLLRQHSGTRIDRSDSQVHRAPERPMIRSYKYRLYPNNQQDTGSAPRIV